jgi:hypothetical protein
MKVRTAVAAAGAVAVLAGCGSATSVQHHHAAVAVSTTAPSTLTPSPTPSPLRAASISACKAVRNWLPKAWGENPPRFTTKLEGDVNMPGPIGTDLAGLVNSLANLSSGQYMGTSTGIEQIRHDCAALGVKIKVPSFNPAARCWQQFRIWQNGPVRDEISSMVRSLSSFDK